MKISSEQLVALQESIARRKSQTPAEGFESLLQGTLGQGQAQGVASGIDLQAPLLNNFVAAQIVEGTEQSEETGATAAAMGAPQEAARQMEGIFANLEAYAATLGANGQANLRTANEQLDSMTGKLAALKAAFPGMQEEMPEIAAMVNELDVLATTERFKFNSGDYL